MASLFSRGEFFSNVVFIEEGEMFFQISSLLRRGECFSNVVVIEEGKNCLFFSE